MWAMALAIGLAGCAPPGGGLGGMDRPMADRPAPEASNPAPESRIQPAGPTTVALLLPLSGPKAEQGRALEAAARRVLTTDRAGLLDLRVFDTQASAEGARAAAEGAVAAGADLVLGPLYSVTAQAARPTLSAAGIPILSFSNNRAVAGNGLYLLGHLPGQQTGALLAHAALHGHGAIAVVGPDTAYARLVVDAVRSEARRGGSVQLMGSELFPADTDYNSQVAIVRDLVRRRPGGVVLPTTGLPLVGLSALFDYYDARPPRVRLMGTDLWERPGTFAEGSLRGGWYVSASTPPVRDPMAGVEAPTTGDAAPSSTGADTGVDTAGPDTGTAVAGEEAARADPSASEDAPDRPAIRLSTGAGKLDRLAMDAVALASAWAERAAPGADITAFLTDSAGFRGFSGLFRLLPSGLNDRGLHVLEVTPRGPRLISHAPTAFAPGLTPTMLLRPADFRVHPWLTAEVDRRQVPTVRAGGAVLPASTSVPATPATRAVSPVPATTAPTNAAPTNAAPTVPPTPAVMDPVTGRWSGGNERWAGAPPAPPVRAPSTVTPVSTAPLGRAIPLAPVSGAGGQVPPAPPLVVPGVLPASTATPPAAPVTRSSGWRPPAPPLTAPSPTPASPPRGGVSGGVPPAPSLAPPPAPAVRGACVWQRHCVDGTCRRVQVCPVES